MTPENVLIPSYVVVSRHSADCSKKNAGPTHISCGCKKWLRVYDPRIADHKKRQSEFIDHYDPEGRPVFKKSPFKLRTRSAADAEKIAQSYRDRHDPDKQRALTAETKLKALEDGIQATNKTVTIEKAVAMFTAAKQKEGVSPKRIERYLPLLGDVDPVKLVFQINRRGNKGRLATWLDTLNPRPVYVSDLTPTLIEEFRNTWDFGSDLTDFGTFGDFKRFLQYCVDRHWVQLTISRRQMAGINAPKVKPGSRTTAFKDEQYNSILSAIRSRFPGQIKNLEDQKLHDDTHRLLAFVELMRWGGLALGDAVHFDLNTMSDTGHVKYRRRKTRNKTTRFAQPKLLLRVVDLLKTTVPIDGDVNKPFYDKNVDEDTIVNYWSAELKGVFAEAGIESVKTDIRDREPHSHMLRDTFAVSQLRTQYKLGQVNHKAVADALGDTVAVMLRHYAPWISELEEAHKKAQDQIVEAQEAELTQKQTDQSLKLVEIGGRK
jgi:hypothetical protein